MKKYMFLPLIIISCVATSVMGYVKVHNETLYPIKAQIGGVFAKSPKTLEVQPGEVGETLGGIDACVIVNHIKIWVKEFDEYAEEPDIDKKVYLDRCYRNVFVESTLTPDGEYIYKIITTAK